MSLGYIRLSTRITLLVMLLVLVGGGIWVKGENRRLETKYWAERGMELDKSLQNEQAHLDQLMHTLQQDVLFLSNTPPVTGIVRADANHGFDALDRNTRQQWNQRLQEIFTAFLRAHPNYFQASYIGAAHQGQVLVSVAKQGGQVTAASGAGRLMEAESTLFQAAQGLHAAEVHISNIYQQAAGSATGADKHAVLYAVTPVRTGDGKLFGMILLGMDVSRVLVSNKGEIPDGAQIFVSDTGGNYLLEGTDARLPERQQGGKQNMLQDFHVVKQAQAHEGQSVPMVAAEWRGTSGYAAARLIPLVQGAVEPALLEVLYLPEDSIAARAVAIPTDRIVEVLLVLVLMGGLLLMLLQRMFVPLQHIATTARAIASGSDKKEIVKRSGGEIGELTDALNVMLQKLSGRDVLERENTFRKELIESLPGVFYMLDQQGSFLMWNRNLEKVLQVNSTELATSNALEFFSETEKPRIREAIGQVFMLGEAEIQAEFLPRNGVTVPYHFTGRRVVREGVPVLIGMGLDVSEQRANMRALTDMLRRNQALMQNSMEGVHVMDVHGNVLDVNDSFCRMLGYSREEALHLSVSDWDVHFTKAELQNRFKGFIGKRGMFETVHKRKDGSLLDVEICTNGVEIDGVGYLFASSRDITERKKNQLLLLRHKQVIETTHDGYWLTDMQGTLLEANKAYADISGYSVNELVGMHISQLEAQEQSLEEVQAHIGKVIEQGFDIFETRHRHKDGHEIDIEVSTTFLKDTRQFVVFSRDITERKRAEAALRIAAAAFETHDAILVTDVNANIIRVNQAFSTITGYAAEDVLGQNPRVMSSGRQSREFYAGMWRQLLEVGHWAGEIWDKRKNGEIYPKWLTITAVKDEQGRTTQYVAIFSDITARKIAEEEIRNLAFYDALTQLPNRRLFLDRLREALRASARHGDFGALMFIDLDRFKLLNDTQGHDYGDLLLVEVAKRLKECVREVDTVARLGGDEFVVVLEGISAEREVASRRAALVAEKIRESLAQPYLLKGHEHYSSPSIGIALFHDGETSLEEMIKRADAAMYQAKNAGRNMVSFYDPDMQRLVETRATLEHDLRHAIENGELQLYYQMQVDNAMQPIGAEALLRWQHPVRGMVSPAQFITVAEDSSLIIEIGNWVMEQACAQLALWHHDPQLRQLVLAINVSASQFRQHDFVAHVAAVLAEHGVQPGRLKLELTESVVLADVNDVADKMQALRALGVQLALDDFGTGYSSLSYLKRLPLDQLKIDQSFVRDIALDQSDAEMIRTIIDIARNFRQEVIAEGVETETQFNFLKQNGCMASQGYLFSKPVPLEEFEALMHKRAV